MTTMTAAGASPSMAQWFRLKEVHPDALLFLRMGDFYELFFADAEAAASRVGHRADQAAVSMRARRSRCAACPCMRPRPTCRA